jgi:hypothetical protein
MGCGDSAEMRQAASIEQQFAELKLDYLLTGSFESELEKRIFMAVNICRAMPGRFSNVVKMVKKQYKQAKQASHFHLLVGTLQKIGRLPPVKMDDNCFRAVRENNNKIVALREPTPTMGGNIVCYNQMGFTAKCFEYTHFNYVENTAEAFVALQLILDFGRSKNSPILNREVNGMGVSVLTHPQVMNLIQCLYTVNVEVAVVTQAPVPVAPMPAPVIVAPVPPAPAMIAPALLGKLKLHLKEANLQHNDAGFLERMSPFVTVRINNREERSAIVERGGRHPVWTLQFFEFEVIDMNHEVHIEVRDKDMIGSQMIGHARVPMHFFAKPGGASEWIELFFQGFAAGNIHFKSEYFPQAVVGGAPPRQPEVVVVTPPPAPVVVAPPAPRVNILGRLKLHLKEAKLQHHDGPMLERMSPFVAIKMNGREEGRSAIIEGGGRHPKWTLQFFEFEVLEMGHEIHIEVRDKNMIGSEMIGHARVPVSFFAKPGGMAEWIELFWQGMPAGNIHFKSEYFPQAVVGGAPMMAPVEVRPAPVAVVQPAPVMGGALLGKLKLHLKEANLQHSDAGFLERMSPFVTVKINGREERSAIIEGGGRHPVWTLQFFEFEVIDMNHEIHIEVRDKDMIGSEMIGHARVNMHFFARPEGASEWIELFWQGMPAGNIHFKSEYFPQAVVGGAPIMAPPVARTEVVVTGADGFRQGLLKLHAVSAHLNYSDVGLLERMSPVVHIKIADQKWKSDVCVGGGRNPSWGELRHMEHMVVDPMHEVHIEVKDKDMFGSEQIGHANVPLQLFLKPVEIAGHVNEHIELKRLGFDAGRIHMRSEFIPDAALATGGGNGGRAIGVAAGLAAGAMLGRRRF